MVSDEIDDFVREYQISPDATFYDFHKIILESVGYTDDELTSFFICDEDWGREKEVTLEKMDDSHSEDDDYTMRETKLGDLIEDEKQKLTYVFDIMTERSFFIELNEIITRKEIAKPKCTRSEGEPPKQKIDFEEAAKSMNLDGNEDMGENFYGDNEYDAEDIDQDGFGVDGEDSSYQ
jgi:hypothetical protein